MKMSRRELRKNIFLMLFRIEFNTREELQEQMEMYLEEKTDMLEADSDYIRNKVNLTVRSCVSAPAGGWSGSARRSLPSCVWRCLRC